MNIEHKKSTGICADPIKEIERREKISNTMKLNKRSGGYRSGSGRGKKGWYKGYWCDSSWELAFVIYNIDNSIKFERNLNKFQYVYNNIIYNYIPDFIIDDVYYEIKGYYTDKFNHKRIQFNHPLVVIDNKSINKYLKYTINKYGNNFIYLYENNTYSTCTNCNTPIGKWNKNKICKSCITSLAKIKNDNKLQVKRGLKMKSSIPVKIFNYCACGNKLSYKNKTGLCQLCFISKIKKHYVKLTVGFKHKVKNISEKNSQYNTYWITNGIVNKKIKRDELENYLKDGYYRGRILTL